MMYGVTVRMLGGLSDKKKIFGRENAENWAEMAYDCDNVYSVEIIKADTGEVVWYKCKD